MTPDQRLQAARAFWMDDQASEDQLQAVLLISQQKKFRPKTVAGLDIEKRAKHLATLPSLPESLAGRALIVYHLAEQRPMMGAFLDALGIPHEDGVMQEEAVTPDPAKVAAAAEQLSREYPSNSVSLYLNTLLSQDPDTWKALEDVPQRVP